MTQKRYKYLFGPVPSRRLGQSLGVDIIPFKTCTQNCIYCQLGKDAKQTIERRDYVPINAVLEELRQKIEEGLRADYITISGSGEPTLHIHLGQLIDGIRQLTQIPIAVITNGTLFSRSDVRADCCKADVVLPSLDAGDEDTFKKINLPHKQLDFAVFVEGLRQFRREYTGQFWLEVFLCEGINTDETALSNLKRWIDTINPDKIQINTSVRPVTHPQAVRVPLGKLEQIARFFGPHAEVIADYSKHSSQDTIIPDEEYILKTLQRRPCSLDDLCRGLGLAAEAIQSALDNLLASRKISCDEQHGKKFYTAN
ncbi:MAG: radical SAM protein [Phycisphaerae bacterium]|nr:radical SAM protein [Phycisphaerae bacterium]